MNLNLQMNFKFENCGFDEEELKKTSQSVLDYIARLKSKLNSGKYDFPESFLLLPQDRNLITQINNLADRKESENLGGVVVIGIGGSSLGTKALSRALKLKREILFAETVDPLLIDNIIRKLKKEYSLGKHYLLVLVSKSGTTIETIANFQVLVDQFKKLDNDWQKHIVVITDENSSLWQYVIEKKFDYILPIPKLVGGRYSVFSAVGLFPLRMVGIDIEGILEGALQAQDKCLSNTELDHNPALASAVTVFLNWQQGKTIYNSFIFSPILNQIGQWWRQLVGESLGKDNQGITPIVSIGSTDLHSVGQLYFGGQKDKFTNFISVNNYNTDFQISDGEDLNQLVAGLEGKSLHQIMDIILRGTKKAYEKNNLPFTEILLDKISPQSLGALMTMKMLETIFLAQFMKINAFNQPAVELYKEETRRLLKDEKLL